MVGDAIRYRGIQLAHCYREMWSELVTLLLASRIVEEWFDEEPVKLELAYQSSVVACERVSWNESLPASLIAVGQGVGAFLSP